MIQEYQTKTVNDMMEGFIGNMSDEQIDKEIKLFQKISKTALSMKRTEDFGNMGVLIDPEYNTDDPELLDQIACNVGYIPYIEHNENAGSIFMYFKNLQDAEKTAGFIKTYMEALES